jgi:hypothetical protein
MNERVAARRPRSFILENRVSAMAAPPRKVFSLPPLCEYLEHYVLYETKTVRALSLVTSFHHRLPQFILALPPTPHPQLPCDLLQRFYLVASNNERTVNRMIKIDRTDVSTLSIEEDPSVYDAEQLKALLNMV